MSNEMEAMKVLEHMEALKLLEHLEDMIEESSKMPFGNKVIVDKTRALELIRDIRIGFPDEMKQANWINKEKQKILDAATLESEKMIQECEEYIKQRVSDSEITKKANENAAEIIRRAEEKSRELKNGAREYALDVLRKLDVDLEKLNSRLQKNMQELKDFEL